MQRFHIKRFTARYKKIRVQPVGWFSVYKFDFLSVRWL